MKFKVKIVALSFFVGFLSILNLQNGLLFKTTDNTELDAIFMPSVKKSEKTAVPTPAISSLANVENSASSAGKITPAKATSSSQPIARTDTISINGRIISLIPTNCNLMPTPNYTSAYYCHYGGSSNLFIYGHNTTPIFGTLKDLNAGATFKITLNNQTITYRISKTFIKSTRELNKNNGLRSSIFKGFYGGSAEIVIQTCHGPNDSERLYLKASRV